MPKQKGIVPYAFVSTNLDKSRVKMACTTMMEVVDFKKSEKVIVDFNEAFPITCVKTLFRVFEIPVRNDRIFAICQPEPARIHWLKFDDENADIFMLDSVKRVNEAKAYAKAALAIKNEQLDLINHLGAAHITASSRSITMRLTDKKLPRGLLADLNSAAQHYDALLSDLKANFLRLLVK